MRNTRLGLVRKQNRRLKVTKMDLLVSLLDTTSLLSVCCRGLDHSSTPSCPGVFAASADTAALLVHILYGQPCAKPFQPGYLAWAFRRLFMKTCVWLC